MYPVFCSSEILKWHIGCAWLVLNSTPYMYYLILLYICDNNSSSDEQIRTVEGHQKYQIHGNLVRECGPGWSALWMPSKNGFFDQDFSGTARYSWKMKLKMNLFVYESPSVVLQKNVSQVFAKM